jgi:glycosyltransferase involved in cell wall biosynthesis
MVIAGPHRQHYFVMNVPTRIIIRIITFAIILCLIGPFFAVHQWEKEDRHFPPGEFAHNSNSKIIEAKKLYIALVGNDFKQQFPLLGYGGIESAVETIAEELHNQNIKFVVVSPKITEPSTVYNFTILQTKHVAGRGSLEFIEDVKMILKDLDPRPDVIWSQSCWSGNNLHDLGIPMIVTHHDSSGKDEQKNLAGCLQSHPNVIHRFISARQLELWARHESWLLDENQSFLQWYGFSPSEFKFTQNKSPNTLLFVGTESEAKGIIEFLLLAHWNPDWKFFMYGPSTGGISHNILQKSGGFLPSNVQLMGELKRGECHRDAFGKASKFFMFVKWEEAFGRVIIEAMSKGTPVLASQWGSLPEIIRGPDGKGEGIVGSISRNISELNASLRDEFNYKHVYQYAQENFSAKNEVDTLLLKSLELVKRVQSNITMKK